MSVVRCRPARYVGALSAPPVTDVIVVVGDEQGLTESTHACSFGAGGGGLRAASAPLGRGAGAPVADDAVRPPHVVEGRVAVQGAGRQGSLASSLANWQSLRTAG